ncbi:hypothetical protein [Ammoniphilus sp. CFH 90114]|uniref:hypothetical protein n=1 Tax=Ammoniphilus sp. CFH 90114 TaxID=2493665 RepID=UPI00100FBBAD|nr:hypothetical protein [Ammoniphilus sp. CFH 90114]RXT08782.1 hypothetical protein EIZ39_08230 [Ammoniphilus sp. CFH 90114]
MDKLNVRVGLIFTQVMFCDGNGKLHYYRVMTDLASPRKSIREVFSMMKKTLLESPWQDGRNPFDLIHIELKYKNINYTSILESLREELGHYLSEGCLVNIQTVNENEEAVEMKEFELVQSRRLGNLSYIHKSDQDLTSIFYMEGVIFPLYRQETGIMQVDDSVEQKWMNRTSMVYTDRKVRPEMRTRGHYISQLNTTEHRRGSPQTSLVAERRSGENAVKLWDG